jgi:hypothetical protein
MTPYEWISSHPWIGIAAAVMMVVSVVTLIMDTKGK